MQKKDERAPVPVVARGRAEPVAIWATSTTARGAARARSVGRLPLSPALFIAAAAVFPLLRLTNKDEFDFD